jgi:hypothetical protein
MSFAASVACNLWLSIYCHYVDKVFRHKITIALSD